MQLIDFNKKTDQEEAKRIWNDFLRRQAHGSFLQSWEWGEVEKADGRKIWRLGIVDDGGEIDLAAFIVRRELSLPFGTKKNYLYIPRGPFCARSPNDPFLWQKFFYEVREIAAAERSLFLKIELPLAEGDFKFGGFVFDRWGLKRSDLNIQPRQTWIMDLEKPVEELRAGMHPKARYNIHVAQKKGVVVRGWPGESALERFDDFWKLLVETARRDRFHLHSRSHYENIFKILSSARIDGREFCELYTAEYQNEVLVAIWVVYFGDSAFYLYGASSGKHQNLMPSQLIQWEAILDAKIKGYKYYDFWGIDKTNWPGVTRFKKGFGGREISYAGVWDLVFVPSWYWIYKIVKKLKS